MNVWQGFMAQAQGATVFSDDLHTQNGALLVGKMGSVLAIEANRLPNGVLKLPERLERPEKYSWIEHAERNVIFSAASRGISTEGTTLVCPWAACAECARAMIQAGIVRLVRLYLHPSWWDESIALGDQMLTEAGVEIVTLKSG